MKIKLIYPKAVFGGEREVYLPHLWFPLITFPILAAYTPGEIEVEIVDEVIEAVDFDAPADLVGLTAMTISVYRAYEIADAFRQRGVKVIMGGFHASALPEEALQHVDAVAIGEGETIWPDIIRDFQAGKLKQIYRSDHYFDMADYRTPRMDLLQKYCPPYEEYKPPYYPTLNIVEISRGCPHRCDYCAVGHFYGSSYRFRPLESVFNEIRHRKQESRQRFISFNDDNIFGSKSYFRDLMTGLARLNINWGAQMSINVARDEENLELMAASGCQSIGVGIESLNQESLASVNKTTNIVDEYDRLFAAFRKYKLQVYLGLMVGFDQDDSSVFPLIDKWLDQHRDVIIFANVHILTPFPGTRIFEQFKADNRLLHTDWRCFDTRHVVYRPERMTPDELQSGYQALQAKVESLNLTNWKQWYSKK